VGFLINIRNLLAPKSVLVRTVAKIGLLPTPVKFVLNHVIESDRDSGTELQSSVFWNFFLHEFFSLVRTGAS
jgi:hypothetical protein